MAPNGSRQRTGRWVGLLLCACCAGCGLPGGKLAPAPAPKPASDLPKEIRKVSLQDYVVEPPDVLLLNVLRATPRPPYHIQVEDVLAINVTGALPDQPISGNYPVDPGGGVNLGFNYGSVPVVDLTLEEARAAIAKQLLASLKPGFQVSVSLALSRAVQQIRGEHLVRPDGTIGLGVYGNVRVTGLTLAEVKEVLEAHLAQFLYKPEVSVDVAGFNSHVYYVIADRPGLGELLVRAPVTGNETVLDAVSQIYGLPAAASKKLVWISRPAPEDASCNQILPVDWLAITQGGSTATNYQIFPGDRIYVKAEPIVSFDLRLARILSPIERLLGVTLLGSEVVHSIAIKLGQPTSGGSVR
jgi:polysaccharide export outer membrane protein